jgi:uncharacterized membrane protein SirB2
MNTLLGLLLLLCGVAILIRVWVKPFKKSYWLYNSHAIAVAIGIMILGIMFLSD